MAMIAITTSNSIRVKAPRIREDLTFIKLDGSFGYGGSRSLPDLPVESTTPHFT